MSAPAWTPGPLTARPRDHDSDWRVEDGDGEVVALVLNPYGHLGDRPDLVERAAPTVEATARLYAAAPDMAEALAVMLADFGDYPASERPCHAFDLAKAALAKARGQPAD